MPEYHSVTAGDVRWQSSGDFLPHIRTGPFGDLRRVIAEAEVLKDQPDKRTLRYEKWLLKVYRKRFQLKRLVKGDPAVRELEEGHKVAGLGIPCVPAAAAALWEDGSVAVCERLEGWTSLQEALSPRASSALLMRYGAFARRIHDAGVDQDDFNPTNILVKGEEMRLIDFERTKVTGSVPRARRIEVLAKLLRPQSLGRRSVEQFLKGYLRPGEPDLLPQVLEAWAHRAQGDRAKVRKRCVEDNRNFGLLDTPWFEGHFRKTRAHGASRGLTAEEAQGLSHRPKGFDYEEHEEALRAWKEANERTVEGGRPPLAVLVERGRRRGFLAFESVKEPC
ncbi:MAG: lipopolysaccharide kinase InaA family protein [Planctomycetota bacterium]|jgi:tRNA A-37 threonylcarbamoyl transferase component Bud32